MTNTLTAIEIGSRALVAVTARGNGQGVEIVQSGSAPIDALDADHVREALRKCGVTDTRAVLLIPRGQALLRDLELPEGAPEELVSMVRFQVEREMPLPLDQIRYSYVETGRAGGKVRIQVVAVPRDVLEPAMAALEGAGVKISGVYVSSFGLLCLWPAGEASAMVEVAAGEAEIMVVDGGRMEFSRTAPLLDGVLPEAVADEVDRTLQAYNARSGREVRKVVLAGEGARADEMARGMRDRLAREVAQVGPGDLETACAAGICAGLLRSAPLPDLLRPPSVVKKFRITRAHRWAAGGALGAVGLFLVFQLALSSKQGSLERKREELKTLEPRAAEVSRMSQQTALVHQWYRDRRDWVRIFDALCQVVRRENLWITSATFEESGAVRLTGKAKDEKNVVEFTTALKKTDPFKDFTVKIENRKHNAGEKSGYTEDFTVAVYRVAAESRRKGK
jgi:Tfp pilus assembly PilM family ATPase